MFSHLRTLSIAFVVCLLVAGCDDNVFSGLNSEGTSDDPQVLLADARAALAKGDTTQAMDYLERAYEIAPEDAEVRVELIGTRFEVNDIDLLAIREIGEYIAGSNKAAHAAGKATEPIYVCSFDGEPEGSFDYAQAPAFQRLAGLSDLFDEAIALLEDLDTSQADLSEDLKARMLLIRAFTRAFRTIVEIDTRVKSMGVDLFRLPDGTIGICAEVSEEPDSIEEAQELREEAEELVEEVERLIECVLLPGYEVAMDDLEARNELLGGEPDNVVVNVMGEALDAMRDGVNGQCAAD